MQNISFLRTEIPENMWTIPCDQSESEEQESQLFMLCMSEKQTTLDLNESPVNFHKWFAFDKRQTLIYVILGAWYRPASDSCELDHH